MEHSKRANTSQSELTVITKAKDLCSYVLTVTEKSPKRFRFTLVSRMQNLALDIIEKLYRANDVYATAERAMQTEKRLDFQHDALTDAKLLGYMALLAREQGCILPKQYECIATLVSDCQNLTGAWIRSDRNRAKVYNGL
jgi:hypothetical protein